MGYEVVVGGICTCGSETEPFDVEVDSREVPKPFVCSSRKDTFLGCLLGSPGR